MGPRHRHTGIYRGIVVDAVDPQQHQRLKVVVPDAMGEAAMWAAACVPAGSTELPGERAEVWVMFEAGNPDFPVVVGTLPPPGAD